MFNAYHTFQISLWRQGLRLSSGVEQNDVFPIDDRAENKHRCKGAYTGASLRCQGNVYCPFYHYCHRDSRSRQATLLSLCDISL